MNKDEIAQLMNETAGQSWGTESHFQRFAAALVSFGYRRCAEGQGETQHCALLEAAVLAEREACAKVIEQYTGAWDDEGYALAQAIRARGNI